MKRPASARAAAKAKGKTTTKGIGNDKGKGNDKGMAKGNGKGEKGTGKARARERAAIPAEAEHLLPFASRVRLQKTLEEKGHRDYLEAHAFVTARRIADMQRPCFQKGDWFCTKNNNNGRCWLLPPSVNAPARGPYLGGGGTFIGPVHAVDRTIRFCAVLVPHPSQQVLPVWVNVWTSENQTGRASNVWFCDQVQGMELDNWRRRGWTDQWMEFDEGAGL
jgi:hypothetical protein